MITFGKLKSDARLRLFPSGEADNLVASHDKDFVDAIVDLETCVLCLQHDNTDIFPQCATTYNCGLTVLPCPRGAIKKLSVIDKIDPDTHLESATAADDYCSEIVYTEVDYCHFQRYRNLSRGGCFAPVGLFFGLPFCYGRPGYAPVPTDAGLPAGLPVLPMGFYYPQASTDRTYGRAGAGVWAKDRGNIYVAPWIQSTESIILKWDGIKRTWRDGDPVDDDPLLQKAVEEYVRWQHAKKWDRDDAAAADAMAEYLSSRQTMMKNCRDETRVRSCEPSLARASSVGLATLYYNDDQAYTAGCPEGQTGNSVTFPVGAGTVGSDRSVSDANRKALAQAKTQAESQLVCTTTPTLYTSSIDKEYTAQCSVDGTLEVGAPTPTGSNSRYVVPAGTPFPTATSQEDADLQAQALAQERATAGLACTYYNVAKSVTKACPDGTNPVVGAVAAHDPECNSTSQSGADQLAADKAQNAAILASTFVTCGGVAPTQVWNTVQYGTGRVACVIAGYPLSWTTVVATMPANRVSDTNLVTANMTAQNNARTWAFSIASQFASRGHCGNYNFTYPNAVYPSPW